MWARLRLRTRILISYAAILLLVCALALYLIAQIGALVASGQQLNTEVSAGVQNSSNLLISITDLQQAVSRYQRQPSIAQQANARSALAKLSEQSAAARRAAVTEASRTQLRDLSAALSGYEQDFSAIVSVLDRQNRTRQVLSADLQSANTALDLLFGARRALTDPTADAKALQIKRSLEYTIDYVANAVRTQDASELNQALTLVQNLDQPLDQLAGVMPRQAQGDVTVLRNVLLQTSIDLSAYPADALVRFRYEDTLQGRNARMREIAVAVATESVGALTRNTATLGVEGARAQQLGYGAVGLTLFLALIAAFWLARTITRPLMNVAGAIRRINRGDYDAVVVTADQGEVGDLAKVFNQMSSALAEERQYVLSQQQALSLRNAELERALDDVQRANAARDQMRSTILNLSVPVLPILPGVIHVPLVGEIDQERAAALIERVLHGVEVQRAHQVILDVTGVPLIDSQVAQWLVHVIDAARLLGAECVLVGVAPEVAQALVATGIDLSSVRVQSDLRSAVSVASRLLSAQHTLA
jgi:anti-anti-sigma factor